jgi:hypothetical protein
VEPVPNSSASRDASDSGTAICHFWSHIDLRVARQEIPLIASMHPTKHGLAQLLYSKSSTQAVSPTKLKL